MEEFPKGFIMPPCTGGLERQILLQGLWLMICSPRITKTNGFSNRSGRRASRSTWSLLDTTGASTETRFYGQIRLNSFL